MTPDIINGLFEFIGALFQTRNIWALLQDRQVKGVRPLPVAFFSLWGAWNIWYYPSLNQWVSFWGGICIVITNTVWLCLMVYYMRRDRKWKLR